MGVPVSTYYARRSRKPSRRALEDEKLLERIYAAREGDRSVYGVRKAFRHGASSTLKPRLLNGVPSCRPS